jgi:hypothetical protein
MPSLVRTGSPRSRCKVVESRYECCGYIGVKHVGPLNWCRCEVLRTVLIDWAVLKRPRPDRHWPFPVCSKRALLRRNAVTATWYEHRRHVNMERVGALCRCSVSMVVLRLQTFRACPGSLSGPPTPRKHTQSNQTDDCSGSYSNTSNGRCR